ncbi:MAG: DUF1631 domain-containing protein [Hydrogenophilaceae bacterium]|nr:DUF1631 domain-containing protein [Hydrogenophilaceae bacterium]
MTDHNVVSLNEYGKRRTPISAEHQAMLAESRDILANGIARVLSRQSEAMENSLISLADRSPLMETRNLYFGAQGILNQQGTELFLSCKQAFVRAFDEQTQSTDFSRNSTDLDELSLVGDTDFEATLAVNKSSSRLRFHCAEELVGLDVRMGVLAARPQMNSDDNPLGPKFICESILEGLETLRIDLKVQLVLLNQFDLMLYPELPGLYQEINQYLVKKGIMPDFKVGVRTRPDSTRARSRNDEQADIMNLFEQIAKSSTSPVTGAGGSVLPSASGMPAGMGGAYVGSAAGVPAMLGMTMIEALHRLQGGALSLPGGVTIDLRPVPPTGGYSNVVRELQQSPVMLSANQLEAVMIDAVAMLFDYLFEDRAIPDHIKALIAQLQVPVLKVAIIDRSFFTNREHPARQVLDLIGSLVVKTDISDASTDPLLVEVESVIQRIITEYDQDDSIFGQAVYSLMALKAGREQELETGMAEKIADMQRSERVDSADSFALEQVRRALADQPSPAGIVSFLRDVWTHLLKREYIEGGESAPHLSAHIETMRELLWSVQPKSDMDSRLMLVRILPGLLKRLREGVQVSPMGTESAEKFFSELVALHANAVRANPQSLPLPEAEALLDDFPVEESSSATPVSVDCTGADMAAAHEIEDEFTNRARSLQKGDWVEFHYEDGTFRWARLGWISGLKGQYLFSDADGMNTFSITPHRLAEKLRSGQAVLVERRSPTDSAFGKLFAFFKQRLSPA